MEPAATLALGGVLAAILLGGLFTLAFAPFQLVQLAFVAFGGLLWLMLQARSLRSAAVIGWTFGLGHFASSLYWIGYSFFVDADRFGPLAIPAVAGLGAILAVFPALACAGAFRLAGGRELTLWLAFAGLWSSAEWLRGHVLGGFPWNLAGYMWTAAEAPIQAASAVGIYGLSFVASTPFELAVALGSDRCNRPRSGCLVAWRRSPPVSGCQGSNRRRRAVETRSAEYTAAAEVAAGSASSHRRSARGTDRETGAGPADPPALARDRHARFVAQ
ncbi:MAG: hypothetical protein RLQ73_05230 [Hoeflea sp. D1-CHI-28]